MLHFIREKAQGWVAWLIVGLISIPFALWGVDSYLTGESDVVVAEINGNDITQSQLQRSLQQYRDQMRATMGEDFDPRMFEGNMARMAIINDLIDQRLIRDAADTLGQRVSDAQIAEFIRNTEAFQVDGSFDNEQYAMVLARAGYTPASYESQLRNDLLSQQLTQHIERSVVVSDSEVNRVLRLENQQREIGYGVIPIQDYADEVEISDNLVKTYYQENRNAYTAPEQVAVDYLRLSSAAIADQIEVSETDLKAYYADNREQFVGPEQRRASHILIEGNSAAAKNEIDELAQQLADGADFEELAAAHSDDPGSAEAGGDLGYFQRDVMEPAFEEAVFGLEEIGAVTEPVRTDFGYHLIKLTDIDTPAGTDFADARDEIEQQYRRQQSRDKFFDMAEQLANLTYENPESLDIASEQLDLPVQSTGLFTRNGGGEAEILENQAVIEAAFSDDVLNQDLNSTVIELSETDMVVLRKTQYEPEKTLPLESVAPAIKEQLRFEKIVELTVAEGQKIIDEVNAGQSPESLFAENRWTAPEFYSRDSDAISDQILEHAFTMPRSSDAASGFTAENGNFIVVMLNDVRDGSDDEITDQQKDQIREGLFGLNASSELQAFISSLREQADIEIFDDRISRTAQ